MTISKAKSTQNRSNRAWEGKTGGGDWGQNFLIRTLSRISLGGAYFVLDVALPFYLPFNGKAFRATRRYLRDRMGYTRSGSFWKAFACHRLFGQMMFDRFRIYGKGTGEYQITVDGDDAIRAGIERGEGFIIAGSHVGSMETAGYLLGIKDKPINAVVYGGETAAMLKHRTAILSQHGIKMIPVKEDLSHLFLIKAALDAGEIVSMPCDRMLGSAKFFEFDFLGAPARFPIGAFILAAQLEKRMIALFNVKDSRKVYRVHVKPIDVDRQGKTSRQIAHDLAEAYVRELEAIVRKYPRQWFNFYDFWKLD